MNIENYKYWDNSYKEGKTGWDIGHVSPPLAEYLDQLTNKDIKILIPGAGRGYEANYAYENGFKNVYICDFSPLAIAEFKNLYPYFPDENIIENDFFKLDGQYNLILEQTFFSAIHPSRRKLYASKMSDLLSSNGKLIGILFASKFTWDKPPYGGTKLEYIDLFSSHFEILTMDKCYNSIKPRLGNELFIILKKINK